MTQGQYENVWSTQYVTDHGAKESIVLAFERGLVLSMHVYERFVSRVAPRYLIALSISDTITCRNDPPRARSPVSRSQLIQ